MFMVWINSAERMGDTVATPVQAAVNNTLYAREQE
jgi:hypothetical protein